MTNLQDYYDVLALHREMFAGFTMMADEQSSPGGTLGQTSAGQPASPATAANAAVDTTTPDGFKSERSKNAVLADLAALRDKTQAQEKELADLRSLREQMERLAKAFGPADSDGETKVEDAVAALEARINAAEHRALVAEHGEGLSETDKRVLSKITDPAVMVEVAKRLRDASANQPVEGRRTPKPDRSAGSGGDAKSTGSVASGRDLYQARHSKN